ncbi:hypothetical protein TorRG33x02_153720 [Trema orientale]|uniref:Uncharacterized protein n=1 Tax=Trema orientale TaxID=63057 RepID=A0A2P5ETL4_TREOI|nr:hypothetical protein TorRG33x02_153720 [Trema orientale]
MNRNMPLPNSPLVGFDWMRSQSSNANITSIDLIHISYATIDNNSSPTHALCQQPQIASHQPTPHAASPINHQNLSLSSTLQSLPHQRIVLKHLESHYGA